MPRTALDSSILEAALTGLKLRHEQIEQHIAELRQRLRRQAAPAGPPASDAPATKRHLSAAARKRMAAAQRRRWAAYRKQNAGKQGTGTKKRAAAR